MAINWFPGHMHKARKEIKNVMPQMDLIIEVLDARIPFSSENPLVPGLRGDTPLIKVLNKRDLADPAITERWLAWLQRERGVTAITLCHNQRQEALDILRLAQTLTAGPHPRTRALRVMILGIPNVGKSTLINAILGQKLSITSATPQTTRNRVLGIKTEGNAQAVYIDTPGYHQGQTKALNRFMNREALASLQDVDLVVWVLEARRYLEADETLRGHLERTVVPVVAALNKIDQLPRREDVLPRIAELSERMALHAVVPISAQRGDQMDQLEQVIGAALPRAPHLYAADELTDRSGRFFAAELIREKIVRLTGDEVPHSVAVTIEQFSERDGILHINALILVERPGQKKILIGAQGALLKRIGQEARVDMERLFGERVMLSTWIKVRRGWSDDQRALRGLGYESPPPRR